MAMVQVPLTSAANESEWRLPVAFADFRHGPDP
jgi:hypothetical protein